MRSNMKRQLVGALSPVKHIGLYQGQYHVGDTMKRYSTWQYEAILQAYAVIISYSVRGGYSVRSNIDFVYAVI